MMSYIVTTFGICALTGAAQAGFFSFASDTNPDGPTFSALATQISDGRSFDASGAISVNLMYDADDDGPTGPVVIPSEFTFLATTTSYSVTPFAGQFIHAWTVRGSYRLTAPGSILTADFGNSVLVSWSDSASVMGTSASIIGNLATDPSLRFDAAGALGSAPTGDPNFAFTLTNLRNDLGGRVLLGAGGVFADDWQSEGSWSAQTIPSAGSLAMLGAAAITGRRRRR